MRGFGPRFCVIPVATFPHFPPGIPENMPAPRIRFQSTFFFVFSFSGEKERENERERGIALYGTTSALK
jgi:hypothetical protein